MAKNVYEAFNTFNKETVNLDSDKTSKGRSSRNWLREQLTSLPEKEIDFPELYSIRHINYGSFARSTKIRPLDDIDLILAFTAEGTTYTTIEYGKKYVLNVPDHAILLKKLCNDNGTLNSIKLVNKIVSSLNNIEQYKSAEKHRKQEAATLNLSSYDWAFDIVPAFYTDTGYYIIPDGSGEWKATDPRIDQERINLLNKIHDGKVLQLIRTLKFWNVRSMMTTIPSYLFETMILNFVETQQELSDYIDINLIKFWDYLNSEIYSDVIDPKKFQDNLNTLSYSEKLSVSTKAEDSYSKGITAYKFETEEKNQIKAIYKWGEIFGDKFPSYD